MKSLEEKVEHLEDMVGDLTMSSVASEMVIKVLIKYIELKHGESDAQAIRKGLSDAIDQNTLLGDSPEAKSTQLLTEKIKQFI